MAAWLATHTLRERYISLPRSPETGHSQLRWVHLGLQTSLGNPDHAQRGKAGGHDTAAEAAAAWQSGGATTAKQQASARAFFSVTRRYSVLPGYLSQSMAPSKCMMYTGKPTSGHKTSGLTNDNNTIHVHRRDIYGDMNDYGGL